MKLAPKYLTLAGKETTADDPKRLLWYSTRCFYWTDDWSKLKKFGSDIPCCPRCGIPGMQATAEEWNDSVLAYEMAGHPGYFALVFAGKEKCKVAPEVMTSLLPPDEQPNFVGGGI